MTRATTGSLLDVAQTYWFERFLAAPRNPDGKTEIPMEVYTWAAPRTWWDGFPNLGTCTWPG